MEVWTALTQSPLLTSGSGRKKTDAAIPVLENLFWINVPKFHKIDKKTGLISACFPVNETEKDVNILL